MPILKYENLTLLDLESIPRNKSVVFIPVGPLEQHGPHLPLGVDAFTATYFAEQMAEKLMGQNAELHCILFPTIFAGCDTLAHKGTIEVPPQILRGLLFACCKQLAKDGFKTLIAVGGHGGPRHLVVLEEVASKMRWRYRARMISASSKLFSDLLKGKFATNLEKKLQSLGAGLSEEEKGALKTDFHGGLIETSLMMVAQKEQVHPGFKSLRSASVNSIYKVSRHSTRTKGEGIGYLGAPSLASPKIGQAIVEMVLEEVSPQIEKFVRGEKVESYFRSPFYFIPFFRTDFKLLFIVSFYMFTIGITWWFLSHFIMEVYK